MVFRYHAGGLGATPTSAKQVPAINPRGLWYAFDASSKNVESSWVAWAAAEMGKKYEQLYLLHLKRGSLTRDVSARGDTGKIIVIDSFRMASAFEKRFGADSAFAEGLGRITFIDWPKVARHYAGFESRVAVGRKPRYFGWMRHLDVPSGCVWRKEVVAGLVPVAWPVASPRLANHEAEDRSGVFERNTIRRQG